MKMDNCLTTTRTTTKGRDKTHPRRTKSYLVFHEPSHTPIRGYSKTASTRSTLLLAGWSGRIYVLADVDSLEG